MYESLQKKIYTVLVVLFVVSYLGGRLFFIYHYPVNEDEFFYLSQVYDFIEGRLTKPLQYGHVFLCAWIKYVHVNEVQQIIILRLFMCIFQAATAFCIYTIGRNFFSRFASVFSAFLYLTASFVIWQGTSFRADPIAICFLMGALALIIDSDKLNYTKACLAGVLIGVAGTVTIKSIFIAVPIAMILVMQWIYSQYNKQYFSFILMVAITAILIFGAYVFVMTDFVISHDNSQLFVSDVEGSTKIFLNTQNEEIKSYKLQLLILFVISNPVFFISLIMSVFLIFSEVKRTKKINKPHFILLIVFLPLLTILFYRNSFVYFYVFILAPVSVVCGYAIDGWYKKSQDAFFHMCLLAIVSFLGWRVYADMIQQPQERNEVLHNQMQMTDYVHKVFPTSVAYMDDYAMLSQFPKVNFYMSHAGLERYRAGELPDLEAVIKKSEPKFIIGSEISPSSQSIDEYEIFDNPIKPSDRLFITNQYIPHWRQLYVAGKYFKAVDQNMKKFDMYISGGYTVEAQHSIYIDGQRYAPNDVVHLDRGEHRIAGVEALPTEVTLRWGEHISMPKETRNITFPLRSPF